MCILSKLKMGKKERERERAQAGGQSRAENSSGN